MIVDATINYGYFSNTHRQKEQLKLLVHRVLKLLVYRVIILRLIILLKMLIKPPLPIMPKYNSL